MLLNAKLIECFEKLKAEAEILSQTLQQRVKGNDPFLHDFKIAAEIIPYVFARFDNGDLKGGTTCEFEHGIYEALDYE